MKQMHQKYEICKRCDGDGYVFDIIVNDNSVSLGWTTKCDNCNGSGKILFTDKKMLDRSVVAK